MVEATIVREPSSSDGTFGTFTLWGAQAPSAPLVLHSLELPWYNNQRKVSCIPVGTYDVVWQMSPRFGRNLYTVLAVPGRSGILFHSGNVAGDESLGLRSEVEGCILLGLGLGTISAQRAVVHSADAVRRMEIAGGGRAFKLTVSWRND